MHDLTSDATPPPKGFPRVPLEDFRGTAKLLVRGAITTEVFEDDTPRWPDDKYPFRFRFEEADEDHGVPFNDEAFPRDSDDSATNSTIKHSLGSFRMLSRKRPMNQKQR